MYKNNSEEVVRLSFLAYGETGKSVTDIYFDLKNTPVFCSKLTSFYSSHIMDAERNNLPINIINYEHEEFWFENNVFYQLDRINKTVIESESPWSNKFSELIKEYRE